MKKLLTLFLVSTFVIFILNEESPKDLSITSDFINLETYYNEKTQLDFFLKYCRDFKKTYCGNSFNFINKIPNDINKIEFSNEFKFRFEIFSENLKKLIQHNSNKNRLFDVQISKFTDMTKDEVGDQLLDFNLKINQELKFLNDIYNNKSKEKIYYKNKNYISDENLNLKSWSNIDWRSKNILNPVRNQGDCGGCWSFSVVGTVEALVNIKKESINPNLSVQQLIDCDSLDKGCKGGWAPNALKYIYRDGLVFDSVYPYEEKNSVCKKEIITNPKNIVAKIDSNIFRCDEDECKQGEFNYDLLKNGPVSVVIDAYNTNFYNYKSGYYNESCSEPNHAVILVGFGHDIEKNVKYWIIRNSWGSEWGINGYGYVKYDENNYWSCNLGRYGFQPKIVD